MPHTKDFFINAPVARSFPGLPEREGLEQFQASLLARMAASDNESMRSRRLAVAMGEHCYLIALAQAGEIVPLSGLAITPVPATHDWFRGLLNIRGSLIGLADLMGLAGAAPQEIGRSSHVLLLAQGLAPQCGLLVSRVLGLRDITEMTQISKNYDMEIPLLGLAGRYKDSGDQQWHELDLALLSQDSRFLQIGR